MMFQHVFHFIVLVVSIYNEDTPLIQRNVLVLGLYFTIITCFLSIFWLFKSLKKENINFIGKVYSGLSYLPTIILVIASVPGDMPLLTITVALLVSIVVLLAVYIPVIKRKIQKNN